MMDFIFVLTKLVKIFLIGKPDVEGPFMNSKLKTGIKNDQINYSIAVGSIHFLCLCLREF